LRTSCKLQGFIWLFRSILLIKTIFLNYWSIIMEFPNLGKHCHHGSCKQLDFLPIKCDACEEVFCPTHIRYDIHRCMSAYKKDVQVPVCPLCNKPVPITRGELPDIKVGEHIDRFCQSDPAVAKRQVYANRCSVKGCKRKELVPITCGSCRLNYCLRHRNELDHECKGFENTGRAVSSAGAAAVDRVKQQTTTVEQATKPKPTAAVLVNNSHLNEDEALALALQMSLTNTDSNVGQTVSAGASSSTQEDEDRALALALQQSEQEFASRARRRNSEEKKSCILT